MFKGRKKKRKIFGVTKSGKAKPIKALTGLEIALISGALTAGASMAMAPKVRGTTASVDPFKKVTNMNPQQFITDNTNAAKMTQSALDPVTSQGESMVKDEAEKATSMEPIAIQPAGFGSLNEDPQQMKRGGSVRGVRIAQRGYKKIRVL
jgi:hypothetical protein